MTADIVFSTIKKPVKPSSLKWNCSVDNFSNTATIKLPSICALKREGDSYQEFKAMKSQTALQFTEGLKVQIYAGYNGENDLQFDGFIKRVNFTIPVEIESEGFSYQLRGKLDFSKSYKNTTVRKILEDLTVGTDIVLSKDIPNIPLAKATFQNVTGIQVLEWLKEKCLLTVYFNYNVLYVGMMQIEPKATVKFRLGWNVIEDSDLKFNADKEFAEVRIQVNSRKKDGKKEKAFVGKKDGQVKKYKSVLTDPATLKKIAAEKLSEIVNRGYEGGITAFLKPFVRPGMAVKIDDTKYPERTGRYFVTGIEGEFSVSGGRQKIKIGNSLGN